jgi:Zn-dependent peptidase ImmA (M78 family)
VQELIDHAAAMGLRVKWRNLGRRSGEVHSSGLILLNPRKTEFSQRITLAHEIGHAHHGHDWTGAHDVERDEREADTYAARLLISAADYAFAEQIVGEHPGALAKELGVTVRLVELWREAHRNERASRPCLRVVG